MRLWAASFLVAAYAFGLLAPALTFSINPDASIIHSLEEAHDGILLLHVHHDDHDQTKPNQRGPHVGHHCCGLFALQALSPLYTTYSFHKFSGALIQAARQDFSPVSKSSRLDRPPRITV